MAPKETVWKLDGHSAAKHYMLKKYLQAWLPIMSSWQKRLILIDGFAGPGVYEGGQPGSPIMMLNAYLEHDARDKIDAELVYFFIEQDQKRAARLAEEIDRLGKLPNNVVVEVRTGSFEDEFGSVLSNIEERGGTLAPTFAFVDPFGYTGAPMDLTGRFLQFGRCEVLIYVPLPFVNRFLGMEEQRDSLDALFGTDGWRAAIDMEGPERIRFLHDLFVEQLKGDCGLNYVRSFDIFTKAKSSGYTLFFGTNHELGLERMKAAMWSIDPVDGRSFRDSTTPEQDVLFQKEAEIGPLREAVLEHFGDQPFLIEELEQFTLVGTPFLPKHLRKPILKPMEKAEQLEILQAKDGRKKGTYPEKTRMRFV